MNPGYAPIALFVYNRPEHTRRTLEGLIKCKGFDQSPLIIFSDGPKSENDVAFVKQVRRIVHAVSGKNIEIVEADKNRGVDDSIIKGVSTMCAQYGSAIVVEDDLLVSPYFLDYMNGSLQKYRKNEAVMQISGYMFSVKAYRGRGHALFLPLTTSWGWATWQRAWQYFDSRAQGWKKMNRYPALRKRFNLEGAFDFFTMLERQMNRGGKAWDIRWYWSVFKQEGLVLFPPQTLVENIGFDGSGTHGWRRSKMASQDIETMSTVPTFPTHVIVDKDDLEALKNTLKRLEKRGPLAWFSTFIKNIGRRQ